MSVASARLSFAEATVRLYLHIIERFASVQILSISLGWVELARSCNWKYLNYHHLVAHQKIGGSDVRGTFAQGKGSESKDDV